MGVPHKPMQPRNDHLSRSGAVCILEAEMRRTIGLVLLGLVAMVLLGWPILARGNKPVYPLGADPETKGLVIATDGSRLDNTPGREIVFASADLQLTKMQRSALVGGQQTVLGGGVNLAHRDWRIIGAARRVSQVSARCSAVAAEMSDALRLTIWVHEGDRLSILATLECNPARDQPVTVQIKNAPIIMQSLSEVLLQVELDPNTHLLTSGRVSLVIH